MRSSYIVVIIDELMQNTPQMRSIEDEDMIQALFPGSPDPAFSISIGIRCSKRGVNDMEAFRLEDSVKGLGELAVIVVDQEVKGASVIIEFPDQLSGLLRDPNLVGVCGDAREVHSTCVQFDEEQNIESLQPDGLDSEEITCQDLFLVMAHQLSPANGTIANRCRQDPVTIKYIANG